MQHILIGCPLSRTVWHDVYSALRLTTTMPRPDEAFFDWWSSSVKGAQPSMRKGTASLGIIVAWSLWKHRNACTFDSVHPSAALVIQTVLDEARLWATAGAKGLSVFIFEPP